MRDIDFAGLSEGQKLIITKMLKWCECLAVVRNDYARDDHGTGFRRSCGGSGDGKNDGRVCS